MVKINSEFAVLTTGSVLAVMIAVIMIHYPRVFPLFDMLIAISIVVAVMIVSYYVSRTRPK